MSRIYKGSETAVKFQGSAQSVGFQAVQTTSDAKRMQQYKQSLIDDANTKQRELTRQQTADNTQLEAKQKAENTRLKLEQGAANAEMEMDQQFEKDTLQMDQTWEKAQLDLKAKQQQLSAQVQNANTRAISTSINSLLSFGGSVLQYSSQMNALAEKQAREAEQAKAKQDYIDSGAWAFDGEYDVNLGGQSVVQGEQAQVAIENIEEQSIVSAAPGDPVTQESLRSAAGADQTTNRQMNQMAVGEAAMQVNGRLYAAFHDSSTRVTLPDGRSISPLEASNPAELSYVVRALGQAVTRDMGVGNGDRYAAVKQYVPKLEAAMRSLESTQMPKLISANQNNRESTGFSNAGTYLQNTGDVAGAWSQYYAAAWQSGRYGGDKGKATKAAFEAFVATADRGQLEALKGERVYEGGPTFGADKRFSNQIDDAIDAIDSGLITDYNRTQKFQEIQLDNANNEHTKALLAASTPEEVQRAHEVHEGTLQALADQGNAKARAALVKQLAIPNNYTPEAYAGLRERISSGETFTEEFLKEELTSGRINTQEYNDLKRSGLATPEDVAKAYGGKESYTNINSGVKAQISTALQDKLGPLEPDIRRGYIGSMAEDIIRRRDAAVNAYKQSAPDATPADVQAFAERWQQSNIPQLISEVKLDKDTGAMTGYTRMGQSRAPAMLQPSSAANGYQGLPTYSNPYTKRSGVDYSGLSTTELRNVAGTHNPDYSSSKFLTTEERNAAIKAYTTGGEYPPSVLGKATALGVPVDSLVRLQAAGAGYKLGDRPTMPIPAEQPKPSQSSAPQQQVSFNPNQTEARALDVIGKYESDSVGGYNAVNQIGTNGGHGVLGYSGDIRNMPQHGGRAVTDMTIGEIMELQRETGISNQQWINSGKLHAVGRYQFIGPTFKAVVQQMGLSPDTKLTPDVQDAMALHLLRTAGNGIGQWVGPSTYATASERQLVSAARILRNPNATQAQQRRAYRTING